MKNFVKEGKILNQREICLAERKYAEYEISGEIDFKPGQYLMIRQQNEKYVAISLFFIPENRAWSSCSCRTASGSVFMQGRRSGTVLGTKRNHTCKRRGKSVVDRGTGNLFSHAPIS